MKTDNIELLDKIFSKEKYLRDRESIIIKTKQTFSNDELAFLVDFSVKFGYKIIWGSFVYDYRCFVYVMVKESDLK